MLAVGISGRRLVVGRQSRLLAVVYKTGCIIHLMDLPCCFSGRKHAACDHKWSEAGGGEAVSHIGYGVQNSLYYTFNGSTLLFFWAKIMLAMGISG